jgi:arylsulfatase A-like enzyme
MMIRQFKQSIDDLMRTDKLLLKSNFVPTFLEKDEDIFSVSWARAFDKRVDGVTYSLYLSYLNKLKDILVEANYASLRLQYPRGIPGHLVDFLLEDAIDWLRENLGRLPQPFSGYFHFLPPHDPYRTRLEFYERFNDGITPLQKPRDLFAHDITFEKVNKNRQEYDEFILYVDREFGRLFEYLDTSGLLDNTWVILTSDHGEMFERGISGHVTRVLYEPVIRIPLLIFEPGRTSRLDVHTSTSAIDMLPTLLHVTGGQPLDWTEGVVLPPFSDSVSNESRDIYALEAKKNDKYAPLTTATVALIKENYKLMYFSGYEELGGEERIELYDLENDPEELNTLYSIKPETGKELLVELRAKLAEVNEPYE